MKFYSTNNKQTRVSLREAVLQGLAPDQGLYMPEQIPSLSQSFIKSIAEFSFQDIGLEVSKQLIGDDIPYTELERIVAHTLQFEAPLIEVEKNVFSLELYHGPTLAFKDFGARFLSGLLGYFARQQGREVVILVATSGDTGSAVANGFLDVEGTKVIVLYPSGKVSNIQEKQFTTLGKNITALEVDGTFDDCQRMVKQAFVDDDLKRDLFLTSANSINIARLIPQSFYYFQAYAQLKNKSKPLVVSVPSGNFGNLTAGLIAKHMGLPIDKFVASTNSNKVVPEYFETGVFHPKPSVSTLSNAMDVGNPSNFPRVLDLYDGDFSKLHRDVNSYSFTDEQTSNALYETLQSKHYLMDPHGAVGYLGLKKYLEQHNEAQGIFLETAHPGKFKEAVESIIDSEVILPVRLQYFLSGTKKSMAIPATYSEFKSLLPTLVSQ